jgi:hypothetical protein
VVLSPALRRATGFVAVAFASGRMWGSRDGGLRRWEATPEAVFGVAKLAALTPAGVGGSDGDNTAWLAADGAAVYFLAAGAAPVRGARAAVRADSALLYRSTTSDLSGRAGLALDAYKVIRTPRGILH